MENKEEFNLSRIMDDASSILKEEIYYLEKYFNEFKKDYES